MENQRTLQAKQTKDKIYKTSMDLFLKNGFNNVTVDSICKKVGIAKGTFYVHFKAKEDIIKTIYKERAITYVNDSMNLSSYEDIQGTLEELYSYCYHSLEFCKINGIDLTALSYSTHLKNVSETHINWYEDGYPSEPLLEIVKKCNEKHLFKEMYSSDYIASSLLVLLNGAAVDWCLCNGEYDIVEKNSKLFHDLIFIVYSINSEFK